MAKKTIVIFDLDGTLADDTHRAHYLHTGPRDWDSYFSQCADDDPIHDTIKVLKKLAEHYEIYILSGRSNKVRKDTEKWLDRHGIEYTELLMRGEEDRTQDNELKLKWVEELGIKDKILCVFEDRARVVEAWRAAGITCFQVAAGNF